MILVIVGLGSFSEMCVGGHCSGLGTSLGGQFPVLGRDFLLCGYLFRGLRLVYVSVGYLNMGGVNTIYKCVGE